MKRLNIWLALILIASALLPSAGSGADGSSKNPRSQKHERQANPPTKPIHQDQAQVPVVPLPIFQSVEAALREALAANKEQAIAEQKQAEANKGTWCSPPVIVQIVLAGIGFGYLILMGLQRRAIIGQSDILQSTLIANTRPWLSVQLLHPSEITLRPDGNRLRIEYTVKNTGPSPAFVISRNCTFLLHKELTLPDKPPYDSAREVTAWAIVHGGQDIEAAEDSQVISDDELRKMEAQQMVIFLLLRILYRDSVSPFEKAHHTTAICAAYHPDKKRLVVATNVPSSYFKAT